jgi:YbbR domain-containing protein
MIVKRYLSAFGRRYSRYIYFIPAVVSICYILSCTSIIETDILIPISIENIPKGLTITDPPLKGLEVRVRGSESLIASFSEMNLQYKLDLSLVNVGVESIQIQREEILLPQGVSIVSLTQSFLAVRIEHEIIKEVPVIVSVSGQPASGFIVTNAVARPTRIVLRGPEDTLKPLDEVMTKPIDVGGHSGSF